MIEKGWAGDVTALKLDKAKAIGYLLGIAAGGSAIGSGAIIALEKFFGG